jgi:hypothetical protein
MALGYSVSDTTSARGWNTRIAAVRMPGCS